MFSNVMCGIGSEWGYWAGTQWGRFVRKSKSKDINGAERDGRSANKTDASTEE